MARLSNDQLFEAVETCNDAEKKSCAGCVAEWNCNFSEEVPLIEVPAWIWREIKARLAAKEA